MYSGDITFNEALGYAKDETTKNLVKRYVESSKRAYSQHKKQMRKARVKANGGYVQFGLELLDFGWNGISPDRYLNVGYYNIGASVKFGNNKVPVQFEIGIKPGLIFYNYADEDDSYYDSDYETHTKFHLPVYAKLKINLCNIGASSKLYVAGLGFYNIVRNDELENQFSVGGGAGFAGGSGGGSSFTSGHDGCDAITEDSTETNIIHTGSPNHYSNYIFTETVMIDGMGYEWTNVKGAKINMPTFDGTSTMVGNNTNGYALIYPLGEQDSNNNLESILLTDENNNPLKDMNGNDINLEFSPEITEYNITVHEDETKIKIDAFQDNKDAMVVGLGTFEIPAGNTSFDMTVTATNGEVKVYTINVTRMISSNPFLKGFKING